MENLTYTMENYLEAIYELSKVNNYARISDIAKKLNVSKASASNAMQTLLNKGLIATQKYREIYLTEEGKRLAELTSKKHDVIRDFFINVLKVDGKVADCDACAIEHVISSDSVNAMKEFMEKR
ncbi:MAG: metal-dependent transcriptional regulator [Clostridiales bacterium]|nr:metal-dependent transcriptional regulator [Clostridiales bacterium]